MSVAPASSTHRRAAERAVRQSSTYLHVAFGRTRVEVTLPPVEKLAFYAGLTGAAVFGLIEWPIAVATGVGHLLSEDQHHRAVRALGAALDAA